MCLTTGRRGAPNSPQTSSSFASSPRNLAPTTGKLQTNPSCFRFFQLQCLFPKPLPINPTPLNMHKRPPGAASFKQLYRTRPLVLPAHLLWGGASDTTLAFRGSFMRPATSTRRRLYDQVDCFRFAAHPPRATRIENDRLLTSMAVYCRAESFAARSAPCKALRERSVWMIRVQVAGEWFQTAGRTRQPRQCPHRC